MVKFWDTRTLEGPVITVQAHKSKLNSALFSKSDIYLLTSGRDSTIRLWDIRKLGVYNRKFSQSPDSIVMEYNKHRCVGYNIIAQFYNNENHIITGSEDKKIYVYDTFKGDVTSVLQCPQTNHVIHLVSPQPNTLNFASSSIEDIDILLWSPLPEQPRKTTEKPRIRNEMPLTLPVSNNTVPVQERFSEQDFLLSTHRAAIETLMRTYGDKILQLFHRHNVTFSSLDWSDILSSVGNDDDASELIQMVNEMAFDFQRACEYCNTAGHTPEGLEQYLASFRTNNTNNNTNNNHTNSTRTSNNTTSTLPVGSLTESIRPVYQSYHDNQNNDKSQKSIQ